MSLSGTDKGFEPKELTAEELAVMDKDVMDKIIVARVGLLLRHPFFGNMATRLQIKNCNGWCPTAATDGRNLYYNTQFFNILSEKQIEFVIAHEILHCVFDHISRREDRDPMLYNIASDYIVNNLLIREGIGEKVKQIPIFTDYKYDNWTSEEVYDDLHQQAEQKGDEYLDKLGKLLDEHVDWEATSVPSAQGEGDTDTEGESTAPPKISKDEMKKIRDEVKEAVMQAAQAAGAGNVPAQIQRMIKELTEPKMNWKEILQSQIQSTIRNDYTFSRPSRKGWHTGAVLPGMNFDESIDIVVSFDMSGSISDDQARDFLSEVQGIISQYKEFKIKIWCFDTQVYNETDFSSDNGDDITTYQPIGGGGTEFDCNWQYMKTHDIQPKKFIMFTDGYPWSSWGDDLYCDTIFVIHGYHDKNFEAPFGVTTHYE